MKINQFYTCNGCGACDNVCPQTCIRMEPDAEGFLSPEVDRISCTDCGLCVKVCPLNNVKTYPTPQAYAAYHKDEALRKESSSGGVFSALAEEILAQGGAVFGVAFNEAFEAVHIGVEDSAGLARLRVSKYVQSRTGDCYRKVREYLDAGRTVLFTGTPCQIAALLKVLRNPYPNLFTADLICHGVPSPAIWADYVKYREAQAGSPAVEVKFRKKIKSWEKFSFYMRFKDGTEYVKTPSFTDPMIRMFFFNRVLRPSCHDCAFKTPGRCADLTLADFWGVKRVVPGMRKATGTSLVLLHSDKGKALFAQCAPALVTTQVDLTRALRKNVLAKRSAYKPFVRKRLMKDYAKKPFAKLVKRYGRLL